jgi:hypothetical protein
MALVVGDDVGKWGEAMAALGFKPENEEAILKCN